MVDGGNDGNRRTRRIGTDAAEKGCFGRCGKSDCCAERYCEAEPDSKAVGTVGNIQVFPDSRNIIPEKVKFTIDLRDIDQGKRDENEKRLREKIEAIAQEHGLTYSITEDNNSEPRYCAEWIKSIINEEGERMGLDCPELMSGPAHDALIMSYVTDYAMIFVRCKEGISHNPKEFSSIEDISLGTELLYRTAVRIATEAFTKRGDLR